MGAVWSAKVEGSANDHVAVKFLHSQMASDPLIVQRFLLEARAGLEIRHPNVVPVIAQGMLEPVDSAADPVPWLAMELLNGKSLADTLRIRGRVEAVDALAILADVTGGAAAAHQKGIVHRDIKPANVFLQQTDDAVIPKLLDFGISKYVDPKMDVGLTSTGAIVGSAMYMSPEQAAGGYNVDMRSDVWSLGVMLYRMLTGESPIPGGGQQEILVSLNSPRELDLSALKHPRIPPGAADVVRKCLRKKREERYPSAIELEPAIREVLAAEIERSHAPNVDAMLRPPSSAATFIAAPIDAAPEVDAGTAPTGQLGTPAGAGIEDTQRDAGADVVVQPSLPDDLPPLGAPPGASPLDSIGHLAAIPSPLMTPRTYIIERPQPAMRIAPRIGALAFGLALAGVAFFALRRHPEPAPVAPSPVTASSVDVAPPAAPPPESAEPEPVVELGTTAPPNDPRGSAPRPKPAGRPRPRPTTQAPSADPWRKPGF
jgi:serine/threonine-protein kinase